jgi:hypothetical protein
VFTFKLVAVKTISWAPRLILPAHDRTERPASRLKRLPKRSATSLRPGTPLHAAETRCATRIAAPGIRRAHDGLVVRLMRNATISFR